MNYYMKHKNRRVNQQDLHIGKDSHGAVFCFMSHEECSFYKTPTLKRKLDWFEYMFLNDTLIYSEEDVQIPFLEMINIINSSKNNENNSNIYDELSRNGDRNHTYYKDIEGFPFDTTEFE